MGFWLNKWVFEVGPLSPLAHDMVAVEPTCSVRNFIMASREWDWHRLQVLLPASCLKRIANILPPSNKNRLDTIRLRLMDSSLSIKLTRQGREYGHIGCLDMVFGMEMSETATGTMFPMACSTCGCSVALCCPPSTMEYSFFASTQKWLLDNLADLSPSPF
ncbi:hypothetical protein Ancab_032407 [Ancistrocladus abbreviatus]